jgi:hypothetical protein
MINRKPDRTGRRREKHGAIFKNDLHDEFGTWPLGYTAYGGAEVGEIIAAAEAVGDGVPRGGAASPSAGQNVRPAREDRAGRARIRPGGGNVTGSRSHMSVIDAREHPH